MVYFRLDALPAKKGEAHASTLKYSNQKIILFVLNREPILRDW